MEMRWGNKKFALHYTTVSALHYSYSFRITLRVNPQVLPRGSGMGVGFADPCQHRTRGFQPPIPTLGTRTKWWSHAPPLTHFNGKSLTLSHSRRLAGSLSYPTPSSPHRLEPVLSRAPRCLEPRHLDPAGLLSCPTPSQAPPAPSPAPRHRSHTV